MMQMGSLSHANNYWHLPETMLVERPYAFVRR